MTPEGKSESPEGPRQTRSVRAKRKRIDAAEDEETSGLAYWFLAGMAIVAIICVVVGSVRQGFDWKNALAACGFLLTGIAFVAIGLLELEWLERLVGFADGLVGGLYWLLWTSWSGTLSDSELLGRRGATVVWLMVGLPTFLWGCLRALRIVEF